ncbi:MAG TPA: MmpS family transport accessory protein [Methylomirabilota bacterium]|jgi:hypothetical protein|nr:MmpS family transport accessory protein [Methylomirabilota bacterium]
MRWSRASAFVVSFVTAVAALEPAPAEAVTRTFAGGIDKVWTAVRSVLDSHGWEIDEEDRALGRIVTDPRDVSFRDFGVYAQGTRHRLTVALRPAGAGRTAVTVERELYREKRLLFAKERTPLRTESHGIEAGILDTIALVMPAERPVAAAIPAPAVAPPQHAPAPPADRMPPPPPAPPDRATAPAMVQPPARAARITYRVTGSGGSVQVTYRNAHGANDRQTAATLPWEFSFNGSGGAPLYLSAVAQGTANSSVTCEILVDGTARSQSMSVGTSTVATCSIPAP